MDYHRIHEPARTILDASLDKSVALAAARLDDSQGVDRTYPVIRSKQGRPQLAAFYRPRLVSSSFALRVDEKYALALYGRGLVRKQSGDTAGGEDDLAAAIALNPKVASEIAPYGFGK